MSAGPRGEVSLDAIRRRYDLAAVIESTTGQRVRYGRNIHCPFHADHRPSLTVWPDGRWKCWGCGRKGDLFDFVGLALFGDGYDLRQVIDRLADPAIAATVRHAPHNAEGMEHAPCRGASRAWSQQQGTLNMEQGKAFPHAPCAMLHAATPLPRPALDPRWIDRWEEQFGAREMAYWRKSYIPYRATARLRIGWTGRRYAFPWFYRGVLTAIKLRRDDDLTPQLEPKYLGVKGSRFAAPYNIDAVMQGSPGALLVVEDEKSVVAAETHRLAAIAAPARQFKAAWAELIAHVPRVIVVADRDPAGLESALALKALIPRAEITAPPEMKDLFDFHVYLMARVGERAVATRVMREWLDL